MRAVPSQPVLRPADTAAIAAELLDETDQTFEARGDVDFAFGFAKPAAGRRRALPWRLARRSGKAAGLAVPEPPQVLPTVTEVLDTRPSYEIIALHAPTGLPGEVSEWNEDGLRMELVR